MAVDVNQAIADYLRSIHEKFIWPVVIWPDKSLAKFRPDRLVFFGDILAKAHLAAIRVFRRPCTTDADCNGNERCVQCKCAPIPENPRTSVNVNSGFSTLQECQDDFDCPQRHRCIDGECVPTPFGLVFGPLDAVPSYDREVADACEAYSRQIYSILANGLAEKPGKLAAVRNMLVSMYAEAARAAGVSLKACDASFDCNDAEVCVDGACVPVPFRLVFQGYVPQPAPWVRTPKQGGKK